MIDETKVKRLKNIIIAIAMVVLFILGYGVGQIGQHKTTKPETTQATKKTVKEDKQDITQSQVEDFLIAYFTKKDLGENRNRYKPFMTDGLYNQTVANEELPANVTYKGFVVDFVYESSNIYVDTKNKQVIADVKYKNTLLQKKNDYDKAQKDVSNMITLKLDYTDVSGELKLNRISTVLLTDSADPNRDNKFYDTGLHTEEK